MLFREQFYYSSISTIPDGTLPDDFHPHLHVCALDGGYLPDGCFVRLREVRTRDLRQVKAELQYRTLVELLARGLVYFAGEKEKKQ